ncbi:MAG: lysozyme inhibitor LprI family protein [Clostridia bacterium]|nr:lysozyme inhibitor LprI family protein [Clostridia bacterium]
MNKRDTHTPGKGLALLLLVFGLVGCEAKTESSPPEAIPATSRAAAAEAPDGPMFDFNMLMNGGKPFEGNPIDAAFVADPRRAGATLEMVEASCEIRDAWRAEMENAQKQLLALLKDREREELDKAQTAWEEYMLSKYSMLRAVFYPFSGYGFELFDAEAYGGPGSLDRVIICAKEMDETRSRALELMEQVYFFAGEVRFQYIKTEDPT